MHDRLYSQEELNELQTIPKRITNPRARESKKPGHVQQNFKAEGLYDTSRQFSIYSRRNIKDRNDFSCGIVYLPTQGLNLTLARYNGPSHVHKEIRYHPHIHRATERAIAAGKKPESEATATDRYSTLQGAMRCLAEDFHLQGLEFEQESLFNGS